MSDCSQQQGEKAEKKGGGFTTRGELLRSPLLRRQTTLFLLPVSNEGCLSIVAENSEDGGSRPSVCALFMLLVNWLAAVCSREIALSLKYTSYPTQQGCYSQAAGFQWHCSTQTTVSFCFPSIILQWCCFNACVFLLCYILYQIELYIMHSMQFTTCSLMYSQYMCTVIFFFSL